MAGIWHNIPVGFFGTVAGSARSRDLAHMARGLAPKRIELGQSRQMATMEANVEKSCAFDREEVAAQLMEFLERDDDCDAVGAVSGMFRYTEEDGSVTITGIQDGLAGAVSIPDTINSLPVAAIGEDAFAGCCGLTGVTIPDSVTDIGEFSFANCPGLKSVTIPRIATIAAKGAFDDEVAIRKRENGHIHVKGVPLDLCAFGGVTDRCLD